MGLGRDVFNPTTYYILYQIRSCFAGNERHFHDIFKDFREWFLRGLSLRPWPKVAVRADLLTREVAKGKFAGRRGRLGSTRK
jgi:hypothetical protein